MFFFPLTWCLLSNTALGTICHDFSIHVNCFSNTLDSQFFDFLSSYDFVQQLPSTPHTHPYTLGLGISYKYDSKLLMLSIPHSNYHLFFLFTSAGALMSAVFLFFSLGLKNTLIFTCLPSFLIFIPLFPPSILWALVITPLGRCLMSLAFSHFLPLLSILVKSHCLLTPRVPSVAQCVWRKRYALADSSHLKYF